MTRQGAERALSELEAYARRDGWHDTDVQGRKLEANWQEGFHHTYRYDGEVVTRDTALTVLESR